MKEKKKAIICLGTGKSQIPVIKTAAELGVAVIGIDRDLSSPGSQLCNEIINKSTYDANPILKDIYTLKMIYDIIGILNRSSGPPVVTAAVLAQKLGLSGVHPENAEIVIDKSKLMAFCTSQGIAAPKFVSTDKIDYLDITSINFPVVVKPAISEIGKSGVSMVSDRHSFQKAFNSAKSVSLNGLVNIEQWVNGRDVSLMAVVQNRRLFPLVLLDELNVMPEGSQVKGFGFAVPSVFSNTPVYQNILKLAEQVVKKLSLNNTAFNMSCRCGFKETPHLIEIHLDMGGDLILDALLPMSTSFDVLQYLCKMLISQEPVSMTAEYKPKAIIYHEGEGLVTDRKFTLLSAENRDELELYIEKMKRQQYA